MIDTSKFPKIGIAWDFYTTKKSNQQQNGTSPKSAREIEKWW